MPSRNYPYTIRPTATRGRAKRYQHGYHTRASATKAGRRYLKKRAYAPAAKKAFKRMSNPLAENKQILGSEISATVGLDTRNPPYPILTDWSTPPVDYTGTPTGAAGYVMDSTHWHFNPDSALYQTQGLDESQMVGRSVYQTITKAKFLIKWPQPSMPIGHLDDNEEQIMGRIPDQPMSYKMYWGTVPLKYLFTDSTTPAASDANAATLESLVNQRVTDYFNARSDRIQFIPKKTATINIHGSKVLSPKWSTTTGRLPVSTDGGIYEDNIDGSIPDTLVSVKWNTNKKIHFEPSNKFGLNDAGAAATPANGATVFYRNYSGEIPFAVIVSWNHDKLPENDTNADEDDPARWERTRRCPQVLVQDITYFRDS